MNDYRNSMKKRKQNNLKKRNFKIFYTVLGVFLIAIIAKILLPNFTTVNYNEYMGIQTNIIPLVNNNFAKSENNLINEDELLFLPVDFVSSYIDPYIFWDEKENRLTITNEKNVIRMKTKELEYFVNNEPLKLNIPINSIENVAYIPYEFLKNFYSKFKFDYYKLKNGNSVLNIKDVGLEEKKYYIKSNSIIRTLPTKKAPIIVKAKNLELEKSVTIISENVENKNYVLVSTNDGYIGYLNKKYLTEKIELPPITNTDEIDDTNTQNNTEKQQINGKINIMFEQMTNPTAIKSSLSKVYPEGIDVLVPTFFSFLNTSGDIKNIADKSYIEKAHKNNLKVWGLLTDNFDKNISHSVLSSTQTREKVIRQILAYVSLYNLDGINIDFESVPKDDGKYFIQFLRELSPFLKQLDATLSVDLFVPKPWTSHYNRNEVGKVADYVIVMGYDQHYSGSPNAGSVATIDWSKEAIKNTLKEGVPKEKLVLAVPFYTRIWTEEVVDGKTNLMSKAFGMEDAHDFFIKKGGEFTWLEDVGQFYSEVKEDNKTYKVWLEDEKSLEKRLELVLKNNIAGIAGWKLWLEKDEVWPVINQKLKGNK